MTRLCKFLVGAFALLYAGALVLFAVGTYGLFGAETDPLAGVFLMPLGLPWNLLTGGVPDLWRPWLAGLAPLVNLSIIWTVCRRSRHKPTGSRF